MRRRRIGEFDLIHRLRHAMRIPQALRSAVFTGIGDDAAVLKARSGRVLLATTDLLAEQIHFDLACTTYRQLGYKAAMVNLSDIAAMGGAPRFVLIALALTARQTPSDVTALYAGIAAACRNAGAAVVGGDTSASRTGLFLSVTVLGDARPSNVLRRSTARPGDHLYVTGTLGDAQAGLEILRRRKKRQGKDMGEGEPAYLVRRHLAPTARLAEGRLLAERRLASAAMDLSDGLAGDIRHLCEESRVGCLIDARALPLSRPLLAYARVARRDPSMVYALIGGEDYELLFTAPPAKVPRVETLVRRRLLRATCIGHITPARLGLRLISTDGTIHPLTAKGYEHRLG